MILFELNVGERHATRRTLTMDGHTQGHHKAGPVNFQWDDSFMLDKQLTDAFEGARTCYRAASGLRRLDAGDHPFDLVAVDPAARAQVCRDFPQSAAVLAQKPFRLFECGGELLVRGGAQIGMVQDIVCPVPLGEKKQRMRTGVSERADQGSGDARGPVQVRAKRAAGPASCG
jgi:hypothetical protein